MLTVVKNHTQLEIDLLKCLMLSVGMLVWWQGKGLKFDEASGSVLEEIREFSKAAATSIALERPTLLQEVVDSMTTGVLFSARPTIS